VLVSSKTSGKELVIYDSYGGSGDNVITVDVKNADAFVCIITYQENFELVVSAEAKWAGGLLFAYESTLSFDVPSGFAADTPLYLSGGSNADLSAAEGEPGALRLLSSEEYNDRRLFSLSDKEGYARSHAPYALRVISVPGLEEKSVVRVDGKFRGGLCSY
jgi:hypothetical protein